MLGKVRPMQRLLGGGVRRFHVCGGSRSSWQDSFKMGHIKPELGDKKPTHIVVGAGSAGCVVGELLKSPHVHTGSPQPT
ncbi:unnamed protein product [Heligmosomoides polygyrus]|uniref:GMC_OxRdtase_N domain-containing protein n=1 Tax=Heligmosomoides polygyrus TaxID=6339 RepID=A0A183FCA9_HELPZ|nr:unnamed protein product [Heligmosomoides polygyrus]